MRDLSSDQYSFNEYFALRTLQQFLEEFKDFFSIYVIQSELNKSIPCYDINIKIGRQVGEVVKYLEEEVNSISFDSELIAQIMERFAYTPSNFEPILITFGKKMKIAIQREYWKKVNQNKKESYRLGVLGEVLQNLRDLNPPCNVKKYIERILKEESICDEIIYDLIVELICLSSLTCNEVLKYKESIEKLLGFITSIEIQKESEMVRYLRGFLDVVDKTVSNEIRESLQINEESMTTILCLLFNPDSNLHLLVKSEYDLFEKRLQKLNYDIEIKTDILEKTIVEGKYLHADLLLEIILYDDENDKKINQPFLFQAKILKKVGDSPYSLESKINFELIQMSKFFICNLFTNSPIEFILYYHQILNSLEDRVPLKKSSKDKIPLKKTSKDEKTKTNLEIIVEYMNLLMSELPLEISTILHKNPQFYYLFYTPLISNIEDLQVAQGIAAKERDNLNNHSFVYPYNGRSLINYWQSVPGIHILSIEDVYSLDKIKEKISEISDRTNGKQHHETDFSSLYQKQLYKLSNLPFYKLSNLPFYINGESANDNIENGNIPFRITIHVNKKWRQ